MQEFTICLLGKFCILFSKLAFLKNSFRNTIRVSNSVDPDQARHFVGPDMGPNCLQKLLAYDTSRPRVNHIPVKFHDFFLEGIFI